MSEPDIPTIFIVDDDEAVRHALQALIRSFGWYTAAYVSGEAFVNSLPVLLPDCVLLDLNMPGMNGLAVLEKLRLRGIRVPVILITSERSPSLLSRARSAGANEVLNKPFSDEELKSAIGRALKR